MSKPLGTAAWMEPDEIIARHAFTDGAFWLGRSPTADETALGFADDRHVCLVSGSRGGKGTTSIVNNLALWPGSLVVIDPKGENASITAARRGPGSKFCKGLGQAVYVLDPFNAATVDESLRGRFNPLDTLDPAREEAIDEAGRIADALVVTNPEAKDPFWDESARAFVKALILHVLTSEEFEGKRNLITIRDLITRGDAEKVQLLKELGEGEVPSAHALLWEGASANDAFNGVITRVGSSFANMLAASPKQYESVRQVADRNTEFIDSPGMQRSLESSSFRLSDLKTKPKGVSLYLSLPQRYMSTHFRWLRMMIALTITEMEATKGQPATGHRVLFCLDEFAGLKRMEVIENAVAQIAGYGVKLMFVLQSLEQLKGAYKEKWETFLSNCGLKIFFGLEDYFSREYVSKFIGEMEVTRSSRSTSQAHGTQDGTSNSFSRGTSVSESEQSSFSKSATFTKSRGENISTAHGKNRGWSRGSNWGLNLGHNSSSGATWKPQLFFGTADERQSDNGGWSQGGNYGRNSGTNAGESITNTHGTNTGESRADGVSESYSRGFSVSRNESESRSVSQSSSYTQTSGVNESVHKRRLVTEDEIGRYFARLTGKDHPAYPGLALVLAAGEEPLFLRKVNYYEDPQFIHCYDPHSDHKYLPLTEQVITITGPSASAMRQMTNNSDPFYITRWLVGVGERVRQGAALAQIEGDAFGARVSTIHAPLDGWVAELPGAQTGRMISGKGYRFTGQALVIVKNYDGHKSGDLNARFRGEFVNELGAACKQIAEATRARELAARKKREEEEAAERARKLAALQALEAQKRARQRKLTTLGVGALAALALFVYVQPEQPTAKPVATKPIFQPITPIQLPKVSPAGSPPQGRTPGGSNPFVSLLKDLEPKRTDEASARIRRLKQTEVSPAGSPPQGRTPGSSNPFVSLLKDLEQKRADEASARIRRLKQTDGTDFLDTGSFAQVAGIHTAAEAEQIATRIANWKQPVIIMEISGVSPNTFCNIFVGPFGEDKRSLVEEIIKAQGRQVGLRVKNPTKP